MRFYKIGMSMVEVMIGVVLLALIMVPSLNVIMSQTHSVTATRDHSQATFLAQRTQEICRSYTFDLIEADQYSSELQKQKKTFEWKLKNTDELSKYESNGIKYNITDVKVDPVINTLSPNDPTTMLLFHFKIEYLGKDSRNHRLEINTAISKRE